MTPLATSRMEGIPSTVTLDWAASQTHTNTSFDLLSWLRQSPSCRGVHVLLDTPNRFERRRLRSQLLALGCTVTAKVCVG